MKRSNPTSDDGPADGAQDVLRKAVGTLHDLIELHRESPGDDAVGRELSRALDDAGPVLTDEGEIYFHALGGGLRSFRLAEIRQARSVPWMRRIG